MIDASNIRRLDNGMTVIVEDRPTVPVVTVDLTFDIGSKHEVDGQRGVAHLFEHLMFYGSKNVPSGEHMSTINSVGGVVNASTGLARTRYFETIPTRALRRALWLEADRVATLAEGINAEALRTQIDVVRNEAKQRYARPYGGIFERALEELFPVGHPYRIGPIGLMEDLEASTVEDMVAFFRRYYTPANAVLTLVGDVRVEEGFALAQEYFGGIVGAPKPEPLVIDTLPPLANVPTLAVTDTVPNPATYYMWRTPSIVDDAVPALDIAFATLWGGASRLQSRLVRDTGLALRVQPMSERMLGNGFQWGGIFLKDESARPEVRAIVTEELTRLAESGPDEVEFEIAGALIERAEARSTTDVGERAAALSDAHLAFGDATAADRAVDRLRAVTPEQVAAAVGEWLRPESAIVIDWNPAESAATAGKSADRAAAAVEGSN
ncbi:M16 family metallopeptidase [Demequina pelophila]|uniref:M16 family metallopeptidase n=1 Tax=Demequina pelophila TaxID=1638984 RepID=UPI0007851BCB|nr:pitrilysin family protein [Demequina pelophila]